MDSVDDYEQYDRRSPPSWSDHLWSDDYYVHSVPGYYNQWTAGFVNPPYCDTMYHTRFYPQNGNPVDVQVIQAASCTPIAM